MTCEIPVHTLCQWSTEAIGSKSNGIFFHTTLPVNFDVFTGYKNLMRLSVPRDIKSLPIARRSPLLKSLVVFHGLPRVATNKPKRKPEPDIHCLRSL